MAEQDYELEEVEIQEDKLEIFDFSDKYISRSLDDSDSFNYNGYYSI